MEYTPGAAMPKQEANQYANSLLRPVPQIGMPLQASILERVSNLEQRASVNESSSAKAIEELYMRISQLEQLVRG